MLGTLDTGGTIGFTIGPRDADATPDQIEVGSFKLKQTTDLGAYLHSADDFLQDFFRRVEVWAIEIPNTQHAKSAHAAAKMMGLYAHALYFAALCKAPPPVVFTPSEVKLALTGNGAAKKGPDNPEMETAAQLLGFDVENDHQADAVGIRRAYTHGVPDTKTEREKKAAAARRAEKEAAKAAAKGAKLL